MTKTSTWISRVSRAAMLALAVSAPAAIVTTTGSAPTVAQAGPDGEVDLETFHRELSPYGKWFDHPKWGEVWRPDVEDGWRPYTRGHWSWTDEHGWYWVAEEEWGWGPFHYGRWVFDDEEEEWLWIPGTEWAPAWVQWRESEDTVGWAPLPPDSALDGGSLRLNATAYDSPRYSRYWVFAAPSVMFLPGLYRHILPVSRHSTVWRNTRHVSFHHRTDRGRIFHPGIDHRRIGSWAGRTVPVVTLRPVGSARDTGWRRMQSQTEVPVYRPRVVARPDTQIIRRPLWGSERRDGRSPDVNVTPRQDWKPGDRRDPRNPQVNVTPRQDGGRPDGGGRPEWNRDRDRTDGVRDRDRDGNRDRRGDGTRGGDDAAHRQLEQARREQEQLRQQKDATRLEQEKLRQQQEATRRQQDQVRQQQEQARQQQDQARQQQARQQQDQLRQQQEVARRQQDALRQQQEAARRQQDQVRQQQEAARQQQEAARRQQEQARQAAASGGAGRGQGSTPAAGDGGRRGDGQGRGGEGRGEGRGRRNQTQEEQQQKKAN